ncbi:MAG: response regulator [Elusimicrobia bacterium]|nr:response regulator [Elusimicrobiota bacterium]
MAKILIVDDEPSLRELLRDFLKDKGHAADMAESGAEALTKLRAGRFDLVTLDVEMPMLGGVETLRLIRRDPKLANIPVLMCTAHGMMGEIDEAFENGASGYIVKPFDFAALEKTVAKALKP